MYIAIFVLGFAVGAVVMAMYLIASPCKVKVTDEHKDYWK